MCMGTHGHIQAQFPQMTPTSIVPNAPVCDLIAKLFCSHFITEWRNGKQSHKYSLMRCWKIHKRKCMLSQDNIYSKPTRKTAQQVKSYWSTTAKPNQSLRSHAWKLYLLNLPAERNASWQTRRVGALFRECKKEGTRASIIYQTENCKADCSLLLFSKMQVVSTEA